MKQISTQYNDAVQLIKAAILQNQLEAAKAVNRQPTEEGRTHSRVLPSSINSDFIR